MIRIELQDTLTYIITLNELINSEHQKAVYTLDSKIDMCPCDFSIQAKKFIKNISDNIVERDKVIHDLKAMLDDFIYNSRDIDIFYFESAMSSLKAIEHRDTTASNILNAVVSEFEIQNE